jgi:glutamate synthase (NADPH) large chain
VILTSPVVSPAKWSALINLENPGFERHFIDMNYDESVGLEAAVRDMAEQAEQAVRAGKVLLVLSDRRSLPASCRRMRRW